MTRRSVLLVTLASVLVPGALDAQRDITVRSSVVFESYTFDQGLVFDRVSEISVPVAVDIGLGRYGVLTITSGFADVDLSSTDAQFPDQRLTGALDTEVRLSVNVVPGRLVAVATGAIPTGMKSVRENELSILGALSSDIIGFSTSTLGTGGNVGGGFVGAIPLGQFALGLGATWRQSLTYEPVSGLDEDFRPGGELRVRGGLEGPLGLRTYLRIAGIWAMRQKDEINGRNRNGIGDRVIGYVSVNQAVGAGSLTLYGFDVYRGDPQIEPTATGAAVFPRGNLLAVGGRYSIGLDSRTTVVPRVEYRLSVSARDTADTDLDRAGESFRFGADVRRSLSPKTSLVFRASGAFGEVVQAGRDIGLRGFRVSGQIEFRP